MTLLNIPVHALILAGMERGRFETFSFHFKLFASMNTIKKIMQCLEMKAFSRLKIVICHLANDEARLTMWAFHWYLWMPLLLVICKLSSLASLTGEKLNTKLLLSCSFPSSSLPLFAPRSSARDVSKTFKFQHPKSLQKKVTIMMRTGAERNYQESVISSELSCCSPGGIKPTFKRTAA